MRVPRTEPDAIYVGINDRDKAWHDLYKVKISTGETNAGPPKHGTHRRLDVRSERSAAAGHARRQKTATLKSCASTTRASRKSIPATCLRAVARFSYHKDGQRVYFITNKGAGIDLTRLVLFDPDHRQRRAG